MNITDFKRKKLMKEKISMLTCYDYPSAAILTESHIDCALVGDSVVMAVHGHKNTLSATIDIMILHTEAVARGLKYQFLVTDLPFLTHRLSRETIILQVQRLLQAGTQAIKIEGSDAHTCEVIAFLVAAGIPIFGHIGLTAQYLHQLGGFKIQGKTQTQGEELLRQAKALEKAGCSALIIECVPHTVAEMITKSLEIPTIGIGAGPATDGQVLVWQDMLGLQDEFKPRFLKQYAQEKSTILAAINQYAQEVQQGCFPAEEHCYEGTH
jgi:3-methyl-2-oxobutanoate hydroxymethyltransferase